MICPETWNCVHNSGISTSQKCNFLLYNDIVVLYAPANLLLYHLHLAKCPNIWTLYYCQLIRSCLNSLIIIYMNKNLLMVHSLPKTT